MAGIFWRIFGRIFLEGFLGGFFWEEFLRRIFWEKFFGRNSLFYFDVEGIDLFVKILVFVKILSKSKEGRKEGGRIHSFWILNEYCISRKKMDRGRVT